MVYAITTIKSLNKSPIKSQKMTSLHFALTRARSGRYRQVYNPSQEDIERLGVTARSILHHKMPTENGEMIFRMG